MPQVEVAPHLKVDTGKRCDHFKKSVPCIGGASVPPGQEDLSGW